MIDTKNSKGLAELYIPNEGYFSNKGDYSAGHDFIGAQKDIYQALTIAVKENDPKIWSFMLERIDYILSTMKKDYRICIEGMIYEKKNFICAPQEKILELARDSSFRTRELLSNIFESDLAPHEKMGEMESKRKKLEERGAAVLAKKHLVGWKNYLSDLEDIDLAEATLDIIEINSKSQEEKEGLYDMADVIQIEAAIEKVDSDKVSSLYGLIDYFDTNNYFFNYSFKNYERKEDLYRETVIKKMVRDAVINLKANLDEDKSNDIKHDGDDPEGVNISERMDRVLSMLEEIDVSEQTIGEIMKILHQAQRLNLAYQLGDEHKTAQTSEPIWGSEDKLPAEEDDINKIVEVYVEFIRTEKGGKIFLSLENEGFGIAEKVIPKVAEQGIEIILDIKDPHYEYDLINGAESTNIAKFGDKRASLYEDSSELVQIRANTKTIGNGSKLNAYRSSMAKVTDKINRGIYPFLSTVIPTKNDANIEGMSYEKLLSLYLNACCVPIKEIEIAQDRLIEILDAGNSLKISNSWGTNVSFDISGPQNWANSLTEYNLPGTEIFTAPVRDGVNGIISAKGRFFCNHIPGLIEDIRLEILDGRIIHSDAKTGNDVLFQILATDEGSKYFGELAFGTNPALREHLANISLTEKAAESFHVALGNSYSFSRLNGRDINVDNGNRSQLHWDITTMLSEGSVELDGKVIQENGKWLIDGCDVLNKGWKKKF